VSLPRFKPSPLITCHNLYRLHQLAQLYSLWFCLGKKHKYGLICRLLMCVCGALSAYVILTAVIGISCLDAFTRFRTFAFAGFVLTWTVCWLSSFYLPLVCVLSTFCDEVSLEYHCLVWCDRHLQGISEEATSSIRTLSLICLVDWSKISFLNARKFLPDNTAS
jgi:hypothetical protein